ncbi:MAG: hypothetical protein LBL17_04395 [Coxiellaceae bacterium]|jgi:hypothetical protein|nr:hypothetical protein [Coxiellaceae bacterium]
MPPKESSLVSNVWAQRSLGVDLSQGLTSVTPTDIEYLCNTTYPFLQLVNSDAIFAKEVSINFITIPATGWVIYDYGDAISTSASYGMKAEQNATRNGKGVLSGVKGQIFTVTEIAKLIAEKKGWTAVDLVAGTQMMRRCIWLESKRYGFNLKGYTPTTEDEKCLERLMKLAKVNRIVWEKQQSRPRKEAIIVTSMGNSAAKSKATTTS